MVKAKPITLRTPDVQAILEGKKVHRVVIKPQPENLTTPEEGFAWREGYGICGRQRDLYLDSVGNQQVDVNVIHFPIICPFGRPGDLLWCRESFKKVASGEIKRGYDYGYGEVRYGVGYKADNSVVWNNIDGHPVVTKICDLTGQPSSGPLQFKPFPWKPSVHMPRHLSRLTLKITDIRVERLQEISEEDAVREGIVNPEDPFHDPKEYFFKAWGEKWAENPFTWVITFEPIKQNIDEYFKESK